MTIVQTAHGRRIGWGGILPVELTLLLLRVLVMTALVAGLAYASARLLRRRTLAMQRGGALEVLEAVALGTRQQLALVRAGHTVLCIGISNDAICRLAEFRGADAETLLDCAARLRPGPQGGIGHHVLAGNFLELLRRKTENGQDRS